MQDIDVFGLTGRRRVRRDRRLRIEAAQKVLGTFDDDEYDEDPHVLEAEQVVSQALGRWATSAGIHGGTGEYLPYRSSVNGYGCLSYSAQRITKTASYSARDTLQ